jgi:mono/diheme cytochrome c family protein
MWMIPARMSQRLLLLGCCVYSTTAGSSASCAADAEQGKALATRWCSSCHVVQTNQPQATDQAPPFATIARLPDFGTNKLAFLLLKPHPNMPTLSLSQAEIADIARFIETLK